MQIADCVGFVWQFVLAFQCGWGRTPTSILGDSKADSDFSARLRFSHPNFEEVEAREVAM